MHSLKAHFLMPFKCLINSHLSVADPAHVARAEMFGLDMNPEIGLDIKSFAAGCTHPLIFGIFHHVLQKSRMVKSYKKSRWNQLMPCFIVRRKTWNYQLGRRIFSHASCNFCLS